MNFAQLVGGEKPVLIDFYADWCAPCKMMPPILKEVKENFGEDIKIYKINTERNKEISAKYNIRSIPTVVLFKDGQEIWRQSGVIPANQLIPMLKSKM